MPPSERNAAQSDQDDDILERTPSHPVTTTLLIVSAVALIVGIGITTTELERYVNRETRGQLSEFKRTAVQIHEETYGAGVDEAAADEEGLASRKPMAKPKPAEEESPAPEAPAPTPDEAPAPTGETPSDG